MSVGRLTTSGKSRVNLTDQIDSHKNQKESKVKVHITAATPNVPKTVWYQ